MENKRLLERIRELSRNPHWRGDVDPVELQNSILNHLKHILNTRQGSAIIAQDFGVPDFTLLNDTANSSKIVAIEKGIVDVVNRYERRLTNVRVTFTGDAKNPTDMPFQLEAELVGTRDTTLVAFETVLSSNGHVAIVNKSFS